MLNKSIKTLFPFWLLTFLLTYWASDFIFFWDTTQLASKHAHFFYENGFQNWILPVEIDSGHPPVFGAMLAVFWIVFGKSLAVSHWMMFPFLVGIVYFWWRLGRHFLEEKDLPYFLALLSVNPIFIGQAVLVSPDIVLIFFMLFALIGLVEKKSIYILFGAIGLAMTSMRGMMVVVVLFIFQLGYYFLQNREKLSLIFFWTRAWKTSIPFIPSGVFSFLFLLYHYQETGWIGHHADSPWANAFIRVGGKDLFKNCIVFVWRLLDFGFIGIWGLLGIAIYKINKKNLFQLPKFRYTFLFFLCCVISLSPSLLLFKGLLGHRYMLPIYVALLWITSIVWSQLPKAKTYFIGGIIFLATGNLWVYPRHIAQGWDATLGHTPYYTLRQKMLTFIEKKEIPLAEIGTAFPNINSLRILDCSDKEQSMVSKNLDTQQFIFYSNVYNDFSDKELEDLGKKWKILQEYYFYPIEVILYEKK